MHERSPYGLWLDVHRVRRPSGPAGVATIPRVSIGTPCTRPMPSRASTTTSAPAKPAAGSPTRAVERPATLSGQALEHARRARLERALHGARGGQGLVVHHDRRRRVRGRVGILGHHRGHHLAHVAHERVGEDRLRGRPEAGRGRDRGRDGPRALRQIARGVDRDHARPWRARRRCRSSARARGRAGSARRPRAACRGSADPRRSGRGR